MDIGFTKKMGEALGWSKVSKFGLREETSRWNATTSVDLARMSNDHVKELLELFESPKLKGVPGAQSVARDLRVWIEAAKKGAGQAKMKTCKQFSALLFEFMQPLPDQRVYSKDDDRDVWQCFHLSNIAWTPKKTTRNGGTVPAHTTFDVFYVELGTRDSNSFSVEDDACRGKTVPEVLAGEGLIVETQELWTEYEAMKKRYVEAHDKVGRQYLADGIGTDNLDGNNDDGESHRWWRPTAKKMSMVRDGSPSRVVIDVIRESTERVSHEADKFNASFWDRKSLLEEPDDKDDDVVEPDDVDEEDDEGELRIEIPLFPVVPCFDLRRHLRVRVHIGNLVEYRYDESLGDKLVLPEDERSLVDMLVAHKGGFKDIIGGKGGGAIVLCAGPPGTGKTLTSEVYAEVMHKALYSVQASQLGLTPTDLEDELLKCFARATRWGAILLIDEADVYVSARGSDLVQNAIVGVFLRVLEYYQGVMFMTTNRADLVDDAIASRCLAKITYAAPPVGDQQRIWKILAKTMDATVSDAVIKKFAEANPGTTGRDVKNLMKLVLLVSKARGTPITAETLSFVKRFKPTTSEVAR